MRELSKRQFRIINVLAKNQERISSEYLSKIIGASSKTIRKDILDMKDDLQANGAKIDSKTGNGYLLVVFNQDQFDAMMSYYVDNSQESMLKLPLSYQRAHYIVRRLIASNDYLRINDFAEELFTSRATITQDMPLVKKILSRFHLTLHTKTKYGMKIIGLEQYIRNCFIYEYEFFTENSLNLEEMDYSEIMSMNPTWQSEIANIIVNSLKSFPYIEIAYQNIIRLVQVINLIQQRGESHPLELFEETDRDETQRRSSYKISSIVAMQCERGFDISFNEEDLIYLNNCFAGYRNITSYNSLQSRSNYFRYYDLATDLVEHLSKLNGYQKMRHDSALIDSLARHFISLMIRVKYNINIYYGDNAMKRTTTTSVEMAAQTAQYLKERLGIVLNEDELLFFVYLFSPIYGRYLPTVAKRRIIIISHISINVANMIAERFERNFSGYLDAIDVFDIYQLKEMDLSKTDFIFTTLDKKYFKEYQIQIPVIEIQTFFPESDKAYFRNLLSGTQQSFEMMKSLFDSRCFFSQISVSNKEEMLQVASAKLHEIYNLDEDFLTDLKVRDGWISAELGKNLGRLKTMYSHGDKSFISLFILKKPILWETETIQIFQVWHHGFDQEYNIYSESGYIGNVLKTMFGFKDCSVPLLQNPTYECFVGLLNDTVKEIKSLQLR